LFCLPEPARPPEPASALALMPRGGLSESEALAFVPSSVAEQFAAMQQQMCDHFTQTLLMMGQMFAQLQREQLGLIREELETVRRLTEEVRTLQEVLARQAPPQAGVVTNGPAAGSHVVAGGNGRPAPLRAAGDAGRTPASAPADRGQEIHALLCQRIQELQQERESHWDKLLHFLCGK
jgi:hypothetical protein